MAKYVGKIFKISNSKLRVQGKGHHFVQVKWYNPFTRKFRCRIISSLENNRKLVGRERKVLNSIPHYNKGSNVYALFNKKKYRYLREGKIEPIPVSKTKGFDVWGGYFETRFLSRKILHGHEQKNMAIMK